MLYKIPVEKSISELERADPSGINQFWHHSFIQINLATGIVLSCQTQGGSSYQFKGVSGTIYEFMTRSCRMTGNLFFSFLENLL